MSANRARRGVSLSSACLWSAVCVITVLHVCLLSSGQRMPFSQDCDVTIESQVGGNKSGTFSSPDYPRNYGDNMRCIYRFIGLPNEKVQINFTDFLVKGVHQRCQDDYLDVYTQILKPYDNLLEAPLHGRYCGEERAKLPHLFISMYSNLILGFYTDEQDASRGFNGTYQFIDASIYTIGTPATPRACGQKIFSRSVASGTIVSPTYPGVYPDNVFCYYKLIGSVGQRVRFTFNDLDMYSGGKHCPYDYIKIYDGYTNEAEVIGIYCGKLQDLEGVYMPPVVFSTGEALLIEFVTSSGRVEPTTPGYMPYYTMRKDPVRRTGFNASFEFSEHFVKLSFIQEGIHIRGTECDQRVFSTKESNGTITTPNYPDHYPPHIMCKFYVDGLDDKENLEKTQLTFDDFDVPSVGNDCTDAFVKAYIKGQDIREKPNSQDGRYCGNRRPPQLVSEDPRLLLVFQAGMQAGMGFRAHYQFITDYDIDGTPSPDSSQCYFYYNSRSAKSGTFKSPRNPSHYLPNVKCTYDFLGLPGEQVRLTFETFKLQENDPNCTHDYLQLYMVKKDQRSNQELPILMGHYCRSVIPGPVVTDSNVTLARVFFHSDASVVMDGFKARYEFIREKSVTDNSYCNQEFTDGAPGGVLKSPNHPRKYTINATCEYVIRSRPKTRIMLQFFGGFDIEGQYDEEQNVYKCANAVLKIYTREFVGRPQYELCSKDISKVPAIISQENYVKIKFISSARATGKNGYMISWSELLPTKGDECPGFKCEINGHCISKDLMCNHVPNCGDNKDRSDEPETCAGTSYADRAEIHIILGVVLSLIFLVFLIVCILHRRRKARKKKNKKEIEVRFVTRGGGGGPGHPMGRGGATGPATDRLLKERTEKVSIV